MTIIVTFFIISAFISLSVTPFIKKFGPLIGAIDYPNERKIHKGNIPRCGGLAVYLSFFLPFSLIFFWQNTILKSLQLDGRAFGFLACGSLILLVGLWDDIRGIRASLKLLAQIIVAILAWWFGFRINIITLPYFGIVELAFLSIPVSVLWFLIVINAINLIDGLDGLAVGISLFSSIVLSIISLMRGNFLATLMFASLSGALLGFLRYNFNPATIFLGDSGSYFIGFLMAALSIGTSEKTTMAVAILIPIVALGLPLMNIVVTTIRRFIYGNKIFAPDKEHFHHKLIQHGYSHRKAVLLLYGVTIIFGGLSLLIVNARDERIGLILGIITILSILAIRKLGYMEYFSSERVLGWFADLSDETGISRDRRFFLSKQVAISESENIFQFWARLILACKYINLNAISLDFNPEFFGFYVLPSFIWEDGLSIMEESDEENNSHHMYIELPILSKGKYYGKMCIRKKLYNSNGNDRYILKRIEQLRGNVTNTLQRLFEKSISNPEVLKDRRNGNNKYREPKLFDVVKNIKWDFRERRKFSCSEIFMPSRNKIQRRFFEEGMRQEIINNHIEKH